MCNVGGIGYIEVCKDRLDHYLRGNDSLILVDILKGDGIVKILSCYLKPAVSAGGLAADKGSCDKILLAAQHSVKVCGGNHIDLL